VQRRVLISKETARDISTRPTDGLPPDGPGHHKTSSCGCSSPPGRQFCDAGPGVPFARQSTLLAATTGRDIAGGFQDSHIANGIRPRPRCRSISPTFPGTTATIHRSIPVPTPHGAAKKAGRWRGPPMRSAPNPDRPRKPPPTKRLRSGWGRGFWCVSVLPPIATQNSGPGSLVPLAISHRLPSPRPGCASRALK